MLPSEMIAFHWNPLETTCEPCKALPRTDDNDIEMLHFAGGHGRDDAANFALETVAAAEDRQALAELTRDDALMARFGDWFAEDPVGFSTAIAQVGQKQPRLATGPGHILPGCEAVSLGVGRKVGGHPVLLGAVLPHPQGMT